MQAREGIAPALRTDTATEEELTAVLARQEAVEMQNSMGRAEMNDEQRFLVGYVTQESVARQNLALLAVDDWRVPEYHRMLAVALHKQGRNDEALTKITATDKATQTIRERIKAVMAAIAKPDAELHAHECQRRIEDGMTFDRRFAQEEVYSIAHGCLVTVHCCTECGELNATPEVPERQRGYAERQAQARTLMTVKSSGPVSLAGFSDAQVLKDAAV